MEGHQRSHPFGTDNPVRVDGPVPKSIGQATVTGNGVIYFPGLSNTAPDAAVASFTTLGNMRGASNLLAVRDASGQVIFRNPVAGELGNLAPFIISGPGAIRLDMSVRKIFRVAER